MFDVITGIFTVHFVSYFSLTDIGSVHSYFSCNMSKKLGVGVKETTTDVTIVSLLGQPVIVNKIYMRCPFEV